MRWRRMTIRQCMIVVLIVALACVPGRAVVRWVLRPRVTSGFYKYKYVKLDGTVIRGTIIFVKPAGAILVD